jgi:hypothetical protein
VYRRFRPLYHEKRKEVIMTKKRWSDLSGGEQAAIVVLGAAQIGLLAAALWDLAHRSADEVRGSRGMWAGLVFINWIGPLAYFTIGRKGFLDRLSSCCASCCSASSSSGDDEAPDAEPA